MPARPEDPPRWQPRSNPSPADDAPRWVPPAPTTEGPRWEPPAGDETSGWPTVDVPRWDPARVRRRRTSGGVSAGPRQETAAPEQRSSGKKRSLLLRPLDWWSAHPWIVAWAGVVLTPVGVVLLRALDEWELEQAVTPLGWALSTLLAVALLRAVLFSARKSIARLALGLAAALGAFTLLLWPVTQVSLGRVMCPARAGTDLGVRAAALALEAWQRGGTADAAWHGGQTDAAWRDKSRTTRLLAYQRVESGCFERVAPIDATRTWHDFRVTVKEDGRPSLSKVVVVRTAAEGDGWKITGIDGPLP